MKFIVTGSTGLLVAPTNGDNINRTWEFAENFTKAPGSSPDALANSSSLDEMHIVVQDEDGQLTGITRGIDKINYLKFIIIQNIIFHITFFIYSKKRICTMPSSKKIVILQGFLSKTAKYTPWLIL